MTRDLMFEILDILANCRNSEYAADQMMQEEMDRVISILEVEIKNGHITVGDRIWWSLELIAHVKLLEEMKENIELEVEKIETSLDGSKMIWMRKAEKSSTN